MTRCKSTLYIEVHDKQLCDLALTLNSLNTYTMLLLIVFTITNIPLFLNQYYRDWLKLDKML